MPKWLQLEEEKQRKVLGVFPSGGSELMREPDFPALKISKVVVPNEKFLRPVIQGSGVYSYLLCYENRKTSQRWLGYRIIGRADGVSQNTVSKYVCEPEDQ